MTGLFPTNDAGIPDVRLPDPDIKIEGDALVSRLHGDIYFSREDGLAESRYVFCDSTGLPELIKTQNHVTIAETGFGTGLNFIAVQQMRDDINPHCRLDFISFESCPLPADLIEIAHRPFAEVASYSKALRTNLPPRWPGYHKRIFADGKDHLHLYFGDALSHLRSISFQADAWFLDGFNPKSNESLWQEALYTQISRCSVAGARLATFTAAGAVKRGLTAAGFVVEKKAGYGRKREMITAHLPAKEILPSKVSQKDVAKALPKSALIIGGGIAGASLAHALHGRGISATILEAGPNLADKASGNPVALQTARLRVLHDAPGRLSVACLSYAQMLANAAKAIAKSGVVSTMRRDKDEVRHDKLVQSGWPAELFQPLCAEELAEQAGLPFARKGSRQSAASVIYPKRFVQYLARHASVMTHCGVKEITKNERAKGAYCVHLENKDLLEADLVFVTCGALLPALLRASQLPDIEHQISAGQISFWSSSSPLAKTKDAITYGGYLTPEIEGHHYIGASFDKTGQSEVTIKGHQHNLSLMPQEWQHLAPDITKAKGRLSYRLSTPDRFPICGALDQGTDRGGLPDKGGLYVLSALGAWGMTNAPLLAEMLVSQALGLPQGCDDEICQLVRPERLFHAERKGA